MGGSRAAVRRLARQQRRHRNQDLYGQNVTNMSAGDYLTRWASSNNPQPQLPPPGWYPCQGDPVGSVRYWDGLRWTDGFKP